MSEENINIEELLEKAKKPAADALNSIHFIKERWKQR